MDYRWIQFLFIWSNSYRINIYKKVKWSRYRPGVAQAVGRGTALLFHNRVTRRGWVVSSTPRPHFTSRKDPAPILQEAGWAPGPVWTGAENLVPTGIRSRTFQPVVSPYTDWATGPTFIYIYDNNYKKWYVASTVLNSTIVHCTIPTVVYYTILYYGILYYTVLYYSIL